MTLERTSLLSGQVAIVTGAARGLGRAYALRLARLGADVVIVDIDLDGASQYGERLSAPSVAAEIETIGRRALAIQADLTISADASSAMERAIAHFGRVDVLVNNAGGAITPPHRSHASAALEEDTRVIFDVNLMTTMHCSKAVIPTMKAQGRGIIINTSSQAGVSVYKGGMVAAYGASKAAIAHYTRYLACELGQFGIRANCIAPGVTMTSRVSYTARDRQIGTEDELKRIPLRRFGEPEDCAGVIEFLATDLSSYVTGQVISVCGGVVLTAN